MTYENKIGTFLVYFTMQLCFILRNEKIKDAKKSQNIERISGLILAKYDSNLKRNG